MNIIKKENGITLVALSVTIIVLIILASITLTEGNSLIRKARIESVITNLITIKSRAKVLTEEANSEVWSMTGTEKEQKLIDLFTIEKYKMTMLTTSLSSDQIEQLDSAFTNPANLHCYSLTKDTIDIMALPETDSPGEYILVFDKSNYDTMDIIYNPGIEYEGQILYSLSYMKSIMGE